MRRRRLVGAALLGAVLAGCGREPVAFKSVDITGASYAGRLALPDTEGRMRTVDDFKGKVTLLFFGFAQCPDVCPAALAEMAQVRQQLGKDGERVQGVFVTLDPERDTPQVLREYVNGFDPSFVALRGTPEQTRQAAGEFKVFYAKVPGKADPANYTLDHTAGLFVFDPQGRVRLFARHNGGAQALAHDVALLLKGA